MSSLRLFCLAGGIYMIKFKNITKKYGQQAVVSDISLRIEKGDLVVLIGPSGCGKTTLLKIINRLVKPTSGDVLVNDKSIFDYDEIELRRNMGYVIQQTGLFPHMTVRENIEIVPRLQRHNKKAIAERSAELMEMVGLEPNIYLDRYPFELSGGQQQRIGVARAFATDPEVILMDEPFSALDPISRLQLQDELAELQRKLKRTIVFVTHDMDEAVKIADKICIINNGSIAQYDTVEEVMKNPANSYVEGFIGKNRIWSSPQLIQVKDVMINDPVCIYDNATIRRSIEKMRAHKVDSLMVIDKSNILLGVVLAKDMQLVQDKRQQVRDVMLLDFMTVRPETDIVDVINIVNNGSLSSIPVTDDSKALKGLITKSSLLTTVTQQYIEPKETVS